MGLSRYYSASGMFAEACTDDFHVHASGIPDEARALQRQKPTERDGWIK